MEGPERLRPDSSKALYGSQTAVVVTFLHVPGVPPPCTRTAPPPSPVYLALGVCSAGLVEGGLGHEPQLRLASLKQAAVAASSLAIHAVLTQALHADTVEALTVCTDACAGVVPVDYAPRRGWRTRRRRRRNPRRPLRLHGGY
jgi:hypothetical protein